jgi:hypothetical protein
MKIWTNNKFEGHYPVGSAAVVVAETATDAADYLNLFLKEMGLPESTPEQFEEMPFVLGQVEILVDGNY